jgi:hypothetical protein
MNRITKDTPIGTRVLVIEGGHLIRGLLLEFGNIVTVQRTEGDHLRWYAVFSNAYLDEPAPGTWAWACEQLVNGDRVRVPKMAPGYWIEMDQTLKRIMTSTGATFVVYDSDIRCANWEIAP